MQEQIIVKPTYTGPRLIECYLKKAKAHSSLGRMISTYNKRFFILDLNRLLFYYLPEKDAMLSNSTEIPLDSITRIYVERQAHIGMTEQNIRHSFVVLTKKKAYKLLCDSQLIMEQLLFAFSNLIGAQSQKALYDWNAYHTQDSQSNDMPIESQGTPSSNQMNYQQPIIPQQKMSQAPVRVIYNTEQQQQQQVPLSPSEREVNKAEEVQNLQKMSESRQSSQSTQKSESECEQAVQSQNSIKAEETENTKVQIEEKPKPEIERSSSPAQRRSASKENRGRNMMGQGLNLNQVHHPDNMVEIQSLDVPSNKTNSEENKSIPALSSRQLQSLRRASASRQKAPMNGGGIPISKIENVNAVPLKLGSESTSNKVTKVTSQFEATVNSRPTRVERNEREDDYRSNVDTVSSRKPRGGAENYGFSQRDEPRVEESFNKDMPLSYLDIMKQKKKKQNMPSAPQEEPSSAKYEAPRQLETEDDWDKELFGNGQLSPPKTQKKFDNSLSNYNSQYISQPNQSSAQISKLTGVSIKEKTESFAPRGYVHNDWDDDL